jgi:DNA-directed RNA polymerase specialized sigma24 family protein
LPDIRRYAQRNCLIGDVDDAVQEALLVLSGKLASVRVLAAFSGWLYLHVVLLRDFAEMSIAEIAAETSESVAAVKSRLHRARRLAREYLIG